MSGTSRPPVIVAVVAILLCGGISARLQALRDNMPLSTTDDETLYLTERATGRVVFSPSLPFNKGANFGAWLRTYLR